MAQPSQVFPPWLAPSAVVITDAGGVPVTTSTTIQYLPPTYFGPSIPLGTLYIFGGTSEPPSVALPSPTPQTITTTLGPSATITATSSTTILTTTATPTTSLSISNSASASLSSSVTTSATSSATSTSSVTSASSSSSSASSVSSSTTLSSASLTSTNPLTSTSLTLSRSITSPVPSSTITAPPGPIQATGLTKGQLVGVIVASILGLIFLFVLALFLFLCLKGRRNRRQFTTLIPIDDDYFVVPSGVRVPGEGSPRHSGEEADPFLQQSSGPGGAAMAQVPGPSTSRAGVPRVPPPPVATTGSNSSASTNSNASGFGVLLDRPSLGYLPSMPEHQETGGTTLSSSDMERAEQENVLPEDTDQYEDEEYAGAYAYSKDPRVPPRLIGPAGATTPLLGGGQPPFADQPAHLASKPSFSADPEDTQVLVAQRVRAEDLGPRPGPHLSDSSAGPSRQGSNGFLGALGLGGLANLGRLSWFKNLDSPRHSLVSPNFTTDPLSEKDLETGRSTLNTDGRQVDSFGNRARGGGVGTMPDGSRPKSNVSARSGNSGGTMYHDAHSSLPSTPLLAPLPRALTPAEQPLLPNEHTWLSSPLASPPAYSDYPLATSSPPPTIGSPGDTTVDDILDTPAPVALGHFVSVPSLKETATGSSMGYKPTPFPPPGLETIRPIGWSDTATDVTASRGSFAAFTGGMITHQNSGLSDDVLEEAPPDAEQGWRTISSAIGGGSGGFADHGRRGTFGMFVHSPGYNSEQGSLHSMRSHFSPSVRSTGSAPAARRDNSGSISSNSSRPSAHSIARSMGSGVSVAHSLLRMGSISSDDRRRHLPGSPALSAFGHGQSRTSSSGGNGQGQQQEGSSLSAVIGSLPSAHMSPEKTNTIRSVGSGTTTLMDTSFGTISTVRGGGGGLQVERSTSPLSSTSFSVTNAPWAGGLDGDWQPAA